MNSAYFVKKLKEHGLMGLPFSWSDDGDFSFDPSMTAEQIAQIEAIAAMQPTAADLLADLQQEALKKIDVDVDAIYGDVIGNRALEYSQAESDAESYKAAGYPAAPVPPYVQDWASAKGLSPTWAADNIIATATQLRSAQASLRNNRLSAKEAVRSAADKNGIDAALVEWNAFVVSMRTSLNI